MPILIVGTRQDPQAARVSKELRRAGERVVWFEAPHFPERVSLTFVNGTWRLKGRAVPAVSAAYLRSFGCHPLSAPYHEELVRRPRGFVAQCDENRAMLESFLLSLESRGCRLVNGLDANEQHSRKPHQLERLYTAGLPVPRWLVSNDPRAVRQFVKRVKAAIYKPLAGGAAVKLVQPDDLSERRLASLTLAPVLFQERIEGTALRVYVVGGKAIAAAELRSDAIDYRVENTPAVQTRLTAVEGLHAVHAAKACGMAFSGVDLMRGPKGCTVIECNPSPMFAVFEVQTDQDVAGPLAALLAR